MYSTGFWACSWVSSLCLDGPGTSFPCLVDHIPNHSWVCNGWSDRVLITSYLTNHDPLSKSVPFLEFVGELTIDSWSILLEHSWCFWLLSCKRSISFIDEFRIQSSGEIGEFPGISFEQIPAIGRVSTLCGQEEHDLSEALRASRAAFQAKLWIHDSSMLCMMYDIILIYRYV